MKAVDYSKVTLDELILMDKVDISQVTKHFKEDLISLNDKFMRFKGYSRRLIIGQWVAFIAWDSKLDMCISKTQKIAEILKNDYCCSPHQINEFLDNLKKDRMRFKKGYTLTIDDNFSAYDEDTSSFSDTLSGSCMNGYAERYYDLQNCLENPSDLQICTVRDYEGNLVARSLIWEGAYYDRIYANNNAIVTYVQSVLRERGFGSVYYSPAVSVDVPLCKELGDYPVPYMDTVCYYHDSPLKLSTSSIEYNACLQETDGESCFYRKECACCGDYTSVSNAYYVERHDEYVCPSCSDEIVCTADTERYEYIDECVCPVDSDNEWYYDAEDLYTAEDTGDYYKYSDDLYYAEDVCEWYVNGELLYRAEDSGNFYKYNDDLYFAEDTKEWYENSDELFYNPSREIYIKGDI